MLRQWFGTACTQSGLGWRPKDFWRATVAEYFAAVDGHNRMNSPASNAMTQAELADLIERYPDRGSIRKKKRRDRKAG